MLMTTMVCRAVGLLIPAIFVATTANSEPKVIGQQAAAKSFERICLSNFSSLQGVASSAKSLGLKTVSEAQWSSSDFTISAVHIPSGKSSGMSRIELGPLGVKGWDFIDYAISSSNRNGACAIMASTPPKGLYEAVAAATAKYGGPKIRVRAGGNSATISAQINNAPVRITVKPARLQGHRDFSLILMEIQ